MRYFTPELYARGNSPNKRVVAGVEAQWDRAIERYQRRWQAIKQFFPDGVRRFEEAQICLHDAQVLHVVHQGDRFVLVLQLEAPASDLVILMLTLVDEPVIHTDALPEALRSGRPLWLYEEFDVDRHRRCSLEVLFSNGWALRFRFRDFQFLVGKQLYPLANGRAKQITTPAVARASNASR